MSQFITATLVNLTPHLVTVFVPGAIPSVGLESAGVARLVETTSPDMDTLSFDPHGDEGFYMEVPLVRRGLGEVTGLPAPQPGKLYIVSQLVLDACPHRTDLVVPFPVVRDAAGAITGCTGFARGGVQWASIEPGEVPPGVVFHTPGVYGDQIQQVAYAFRHRSRIEPAPWDAHFKRVLDLSRAPHEPGYAAYFRRI